MTTILAGPPSSPDEDGQEVVSDVARTGRRRQLTVVWMYTSDSPAPAHRRDATRPNPYLVEVVQRGHGPRHRRPCASWPAVTSETLGSRRRFRRVLVAVIVLAAATCALLAVLFGVGGDVIDHVATALAAHIDR